MPTSSLATSAENTQSEKIGPEKPIEQKDIIKIERKFVVFSDREEIESQLAAKGIIPFRIEQYYLNPKRKVAERFRAIAKLGKSARHYVDSALEHCIRHTALSENQTQVTGYIKSKMHDNHGIKIREAMQDSAFQPDEKTMIPGSRLIQKTRYRFNDPNDRELIIDVDFFDSPAGICLVEVKAKQGLPIEKIEELNLKLQDYQVGQIPLDGQIVAVSSEHIKEFSNLTLATRSEKNIAAALEALRAGELGKRRKPCAFEAKKG